MSLNENSLSSRSTKSEVPPVKEENGNTNILNLLRNYEEELQQSIKDIDKEANEKPVSNPSYQYNQNNKSYPDNDENELSDPHQTTPDNMIISNSMPEENSSELEKDLINDAEIHSHLPIDELQNGFLTNLNNFMNNPNSKDDLKQYSKPIKLVKHLSDDASPMDDETDMSDIISTSLSDINSENKNIFSIISGISSKQVEDSHSNLSYLNYPINDQQSSNFYSISKDDEYNNKQDQISHISGSQITNNYMNKTPSLEVIPEDDEDDANHNYSNGESGIPLGMTRGSKASKDLSSFIQNNAINKKDEKSSKNKNTPISLVESQKHGRNNSGEFIGKNPSLMTIVEEDDDNEENVEYEEDFEDEEECKNSINEIKDNEKEDNHISKANKLNKYEKIAKELMNGYGKDISTNKRTISQSESQHNLTKGPVKQIQTSNSTSNIPLQYYIKSYSGFNSKVINLNPIDDNEGYEYEYSDNENEPISLMEASDINISSHQSGLNGSRTIDDLVAEQKKIQVASSSSAISSLIASKEGNDNSYINGHKKSSKKRSNISLSELKSSPKSSFTAEDMMRLQNVSFPTSKENSPQSANKMPKSKYSEEQKSFNKSQKNDESELDGNDILSSFIESQHSKAKSDKLTNLDEFINSDASIRANNADNIESIISNIEEKNSNEKTISSGFDSSRFNDILNDNEEEFEEDEEDEEDEASFEQVTYEVITDNIDNKEEVEYSDNSSKSDKGKKIESFSEKNSQKNSADDKKDENLSLGNSILSDFTDGNSQSENNKSDKASNRSSLSNRSISNSDNKPKSADEMDDFINSLTSDFIEATAAEVEAGREKKKEKTESNDFESDFVNDENSNINVDDPPSLIESKTKSKTSDTQISVDFIEESETGKKSSISNDLNSTSKNSVESSISLSSDFADESKSDASSVATENQSISISFVEKSNYSSSSTKKNKRKKKKKGNKKSSGSNSEINADSLSSEIISEEKKSNSSSNSNKSYASESFDNSSQFIDVESLKSNTKEESSNSISEKSGSVEKESDFIDSISSIKSKTKTSSSSSSSNKSSKVSDSDSINVESIHSLASNSKSGSSSNKASETSSAGGESIHSLSSNYSASSKSSSSKRSSESNKASESDSINVESIHSLKSSSESQSESSKKSQSDSINVESIHSIVSSSNSKSSSESSKASETSSVGGESIHSLSSNYSISSKSSSSKRSSESNKASESDSINVESIHSLKSSSSSKSSKSSRSHSRTSDSIGIESIHSKSSSSSKSQSKSRSELSKTSDFVDVESFNSHSSSKSTTKSQSDFINTLSSDSKSKTKSKSKSSSDSKKSDSDQNAKSFFEFSDPISDTNKEKENDSSDTKSLPKLQVINSPKQGQIAKQKHLSVSSQNQKKKSKKEEENEKKSKKKVRVNKSSDQEDEIEKPIKLSESKSKSKISTVSILDEIGSETSLSHLTISANSSEKASGEFIGTIDVSGDKSMVSNISTESSKNSEKIVYSDDSLRKEKVPKIPKVLLKKSKSENKDSPRRKLKNSDDDDDLVIENDFVDYNSKSDDDNGRVLKFKKLQISKAYDYPSKFNEELDSSLNSTKVDRSDEIIEEENENEEVEVVNMTESIIKKPRNKTSKRVIIDLKNSNKNESVDKNNIKSPNRIERLSMSPMFRNDIMPSKGNITLTNITNISNNENRSKHSHAHKHRHRNQNKTEVGMGIQKVHDEDNKKGIKTPQPVHRVIKFSRSPTTITNNNTTVTDTSIRMSSIPSAAEMVDQNYVNTLKSAKLSLQYIKESINASRQMRYTRQSAMDPFQYTVNP